MKKALKVILRLLIILVVIIIMIIAGCLAGILYTRWSKDNQEMINESGDIIKVGDNVVIEDNVTCLFMGVNGALTDFIMLGQYNPNTREVDLMSIPRDTKVNGTIDGKINSAYSGVDPMRTVNKVEDLTGVEIDYYILFKTKVLRDLVDAVDGVTVTVPINMNYDDPYQNLYIHLNKGTYKLTGKQAEQFCRFRKNNDGSGYPNGDIGRVAAQQSFIKAMIARCLEPQNLLRIGTLVDIVLENTKTNITMDIASQYIDDAVAFKMDRIRIETLPGEGGYGENGVSYFFMDKAAAKELIDDMFNKETTVEDVLNMQEHSGENLNQSNKSGDKIRIEVLNNGTTNKIFSTVVDTLNQTGYSVVRVGNYTGNLDDYSRIITHTDTMEGLEKADDLSKIVGISKIENSSEMSSEVEFTVILGPKYQL
ncbi:MAG: LCP family protein [Clostridia bacterium]|nr:LCP family protein [Clostridia bacterium]